MNWKRLEISSKNDMDRQKEARTKMVFNADAGEKRAVCVYEFCLADFEGKNNAQPKPAKKVENKKNT